jgi:zinc D-Ala-D-Ala dipeptidase
MHSPPFQGSHAFAPIPIVDLSELHSGIVSEDTLADNASGHAASEEPLANLLFYGIAGQEFYSRGDGKNFPYNRRIEGAIDGLYARVSVAKLLRQANDFLRSVNLELYLFDAYRPIECQRGLWKFFSETYRSEHPGASESAVDTFTRTYVSDPRSFTIKDATTHPLHSTGAAIDLTLRNPSTGEILDMGTYFDDPSERSCTHFFEQELQAGNITENDPRLLSRRVLYGAMTRAGFTNYPYEFWHYDYGNRMYALMLKRQGVPSEARKVRFLYIPFDRNGNAPR